MYAFDRKPSPLAAQPASRQAAATQPATSPAKPQYVWMYGTQTIGPGASRSKPALKTPDDGGPPGPAPGTMPGASAQPVQPGPIAEPLPAPGDSGADPLSGKQVGATLTVTWRPHPNFGPNNAQLKLDFVAKFRNDGNFDPKFAEFAQNAADYWEFSDGPRKGQKSVTTMHDDGYSRKDDTKHTYNSVDFVQGDSPGFKNSAELAADDNLFYIFTAEQLIKDSRTGAQICKVGPRSQTVQGAHPRTSTLTKPIVLTDTKP